LLDTTYLVDADRSGAALDAVIEDEDDVAIAAVTLAELLVGVELSAGRARIERRHFVDEVRTTIPIVNYDNVVASSHAQLLIATRRQGRPRGAHDLIIAASARATEREIVSADTSAFEDLPGVILRSHGI
jgi:tRNA(fMet)-specific endonuclease VapC